MQRAAPYLLVAISITVLYGCEQHADRTELAGSTMGTTWNIVIGAALPEQKRRDLRSKIRTRLEEINRIMSTYRNDSELSRINRSRETDWIDISEELYGVISEAVEIGQLTGGAFDITIGPLVNLWGFGPGDTERRVPAEAKIRSTLQHTGHANLKLGLTPPSIKKTRPELYLDLSGIAKGHAVDEVAAVLEANHFHDYLVDIGGEVRARGRSPEGRPWRIGIEKPVAGERSVQAIVPLRDMAMATSGDYRNYFEQEGIRYSHTLDPRTGYPVRHNLVSVTVLDESAMTADALATALLVMGPTDALQFAARNRLPAFFIIRTGDGYIEQHTEAFRPYLERNGETR